jgi:hypothetical protein
MTTYKQDFPFVEHSRIDINGDQSGDYANSQQELRDRGYAESQIWSVIEGDDEKKWKWNLIRRIGTMTENEKKKHVSLVSFDKTKKHRTLILDTSIKLIVSEQLFDRIHNNQEALIDFVVKNTFKNNSRFVINATSQESTND